MDYASDQQQITVIPQISCRPNKAKIYILTSKRSFHLYCCLHFSYLRMQPLCSHQPCNAFQQLLLRQSGAIQTQRVVFPSSISSHVIHDNSEKHRLAHPSKMQGQFKLTSQEYWWCVRKIRLFRFHSPQFTSCCCIPKLVNVGQWNQNNALSF